MIGAVVGEYFGGSFNALGVLIKSDAAIFEFTTAWAGIVVASVLGIALYLVVAVAERRFVRWAPEVRGWPLGALRDRNTLSLARKRSTIPAMSHPRRRRAA